MKPDKVRLVVDNCSWLLMISEFIFVFGFEPSIIGFMITWVGYFDF